MNQRERLREQIEKERTRLNRILEDGGKVEDAYEAEHPGGPAAGRVSFGIRNRLNGADARFCVSFF